MSEIRYDVWKSRTGKMKETTTPKLNALPPTTEAFEENVKHAHLQTCIWKAACDEDPPDTDPTCYGWCKAHKNKSLIPITVPIDVPPVPPEILQMEIEHVQLADADVLVLNYLVQFFVTVTS